MTGPTRTGKSGENSQAVETYPCANRLLKLPLVSTISSTISSTYISVKESHSSIHSVLDFTEEKLKPVCSTLEGPLKSIDGIICGGLNFFENTVGSLYSSVSNTVRDTIGTVKHYCTEIISNVTGSPSVLSAEGVKDHIKKSN